MNVKREDKAVTEIIGTILILSITVGLFSVVYISVLSVSPSPPTPSVNILGKLEGNNIILEHRGGGALGLNTIFIVTIGSATQNLTVGDYLTAESKENNIWNVGERLVYPAGDVAGREVEITVVDKKSNSVIMMGILQEGEKQ